MPLLQNVLTGASSALNSAHAVPHLSLPAPGFAAPPPESLSACHSRLVPACFLQPVNPRGLVDAASESWQILEGKKKKTHPRKKEWQFDTALSQGKRALRVTQAWTPRPRAQSQLRLHLPRFTDPPLHAGGPDASVYAPSSRPSAGRPQDRAASHHWTSSVPSILSFHIYSFLHSSLSPHLLPPPPDEVSLFLKFDPIEQNRKKGSPGRCGSLPQGGTAWSVEGVQRDTPSTPLCLTMTSGHLGISLQRTSMRGLCAAFSAKLTCRATSQRLRETATDLKSAASCHFLKALKRRLILHCDSVVQGTHVSPFFSHSD